MGKVKAMIMDIEEKVWDNITEEMVSECEHVTELYSKVMKEINNDFIIGAFDDVVENVCNEAWNEYWGEKQYA
tara:strand:- start:74 stop:292 length:219 start_codon:yes stop_codon:yes gene_type:complete